jgi:hypothetical protein
VQVQAHVLIEIVVVGERAQLGDVPRGHADVDDQLSVFEAIRRAPPR